MIRRRAVLILAIMTAAVLAPYSAAFAQEDEPEPTLDSNFAGAGFGEQRSEEHTSELQSH